MRLLGGLSVLPTSPHKVPRRSPQARGDKYVHRIKETPISFLLAPPASHSKNRQKTHHLIGERHDSLSARLFREMHNARVARIDARCDNAVVVENTASLSLYLSLWLPGVSDCPLQHVGHFATQDGVVELVELCVC